MHRYAFDKSISTAKDLRNMWARVHYKMPDMTRDDYISRDLKSRGEKENTIKLALGKTKGPPLLAEVIHSRLLVKCPYCGAGNAWERGEDFYCMECLMSSNGGKPRPVKQPRDLLKIMKLLEKRAKFKERNFIIGETLAVIQKENNAMRKEDKNLLIAER